MLETFAACFNNCTTGINLEIKDWFIAVILIIAYLGFLFDALEEYKEGKKDKLYFMIIVMLLLMLLIGYVLYNKI